MKRLTYYFTVLVFLLTVAYSSIVAAEETTGSQEVLIHLSKYSNDLHAVNMALKIGGMLAKEGANVTMFLDLEGVRLVDERQPYDFKWGWGETVEDLYNTFIQAGGNVLVCPHCAKAAGVQNLRKGAVIATSETLSKAILDADKILDY